MNKLAKNFLLLVALATYAITQPTSASEDVECLFTPNGALCLKDSGAEREVWIDVDATLDKEIQVAAEVLADELLAEAAAEIITTQIAHTTVRGQLTRALTTLQSDINRRVNEIDGSPRDIFKGQIYRSLNLTAANICSYLTSQVISTLIIEKKAEVVLGLVEQYHVKSVELETEFTKSHRSEHTKNKIRNRLVDLQRLEYTLTRIGKDAIKSQKNRS